MKRVYICYDSIFLWLGESTVEQTRTRLTQLSWSKDWTIGIYEDWACAIMRIESAPVLFITDRSYFVAQKEVISFMTKIFMGKLKH